MKVELKKNCRKYMFRACMVLLCSLLFVGVITLSPNIVHAAEEAGTEAGTEAATIEDVTDVVDTSDMGCVTMAVKSFDREYYRHHHANRQWYYRILLFFLR